MTAIMKLRTNRNLTQKELAEKLGVTQGLVSMWESGKATPQTKLIPKIALCLNCEISDLFNEKNESA